MKDKNKIIHLRKTKKYLALRSHNGYLDCLVDRKKVMLFLRYGSKNKNVFLIFFTLICFINWQILTHF